MQAAALVAGCADEKPWCEIRALVDEAWFVDCNVDAAMERVLARQTANGAAPALASKRVETNDRPNALLIMQSRRNAHVVLPDLPLQNPK